MTSRTNFSGVISPVLTPFGEDGTPDLDRFIEHAQWLLDDGCTALAPFGTTSEGNSLGLDERMELLEALIDDGDIEPSLLMPGTGSCSVSDAVILTRHAVDMGCGGVLMLPPFYYKNPSEEGLFRFYADVIEGVDDDRLRLYLYHIPPMAVVGIPQDLITRLRREFPKIVVGIKDSSGDPATLDALLENNPGFEVFPGAESLLLRGLRKGAAGCISATANIGAKGIREVYDKWRTPEADDLNAKVVAFRQTMQGFAMIPALKAIVAHYRQDPAWAAVRPPLVGATPDEAKRIVDTIADKHGFRLEFEDEEA